MARLNHGVTVIWLDTYIGNPQDYSYLKAMFSSNIDPTNLKPIKLINNDTINTPFMDLHSLLAPRTGIPCEFKSFTDPDACLKSIDESLNADKRIFFIVSDSIGRTFLPHIAMRYPQAFRSSEGEPGISIYIFAYYVINYIDFMDCLYDYLEYVIVFSHEIDLLWRLVHDIAKYYTEAGKRLLDRDTPVDTRQALIYFEWANALCQHTKSIAIYQDSYFIQALENLMHLAKEKIENDTFVTQNDQYSRADIERNLNNSLFIYHAMEFPDETAQLVGTLNRLTSEKIELFDDLDEFIVKFQQESCTINDYCPIVICSDNDDRINILEELSSSTSVNYIYILSPNESIVQGNETLKKFPKVRNIYSDARVLALEWTAERAFNCTKIGRLCMKKGDSNVARMYYAKATELNEHLIDFVKED